MKCPHCGFYHLTVQERCAKCKKPFNAEAVLEASDTGLEITIPPSPTPTGSRKTVLKPPPPVKLEAPEPEVPADRESGAKTEPPPPRPVRAAVEVSEAPGHDDTRPDPKKDRFLTERSSELKEFWGDEESELSEASRSALAEPVQATASQSELSLSNLDQDPDALLLQVLKAETSLTLGEASAEPTAEIEEDTADFSESSAELRFDNALKEVEQAFRSGPPPVPPADDEESMGSDPCLSASLIDGLEQVISNPVAPMAAAEPAALETGSAEFEEDSFELSEAPEQSSSSALEVSQVRMKKPSEKIEPEPPVRTEPQLKARVLRPRMTDEEPRPSRHEVEAENSDPRSRDLSLIELMEDELEKKGRLEKNFDESYQEASASRSLEQEKGVRVLRWEHEMPLETKPQSLLIRRAAAGGFDLMVWTAIGFALFAGARLIGGFSELHGSIGQWLYLVALPLAMISGILALVYGGLFVSLVGRTPGMMLLKLKLADENGDRPSLSRAFKRTGILIMSLTPMGLGLITMLIRHGDQSLFDQFTRTRVQRG